MELFTKEQYSNALRKTKLNLKCDLCGKTFQRTKHHHYTAKSYNGFLYDYCSRICGTKANQTGYSVPCSHCGTIIYRRKQQFEKHNQKAFCNYSCSALYNNSRRTCGSGVSKLERWLQTKLINLYPRLNFVFNGNEAINSQLDIFIPSLNLAFELNGPFHYEPIFGKEKLDKIQNNDQRKFQACLERNIELCIIDTSKQKYFKEKTSQPFLDIIVDVISNKHAQ